MAEPVTQNRYIYVHNNPLLYVDPKGFSAFSLNLGYGPQSASLVLNPKTGEVFISESTITYGTDIGASLAFSPFATPQEGIKTSVFAEVTGAGKFKFETNPNNVKNALNNLGANIDVGMVPGKSAEIDASIAFGAKLGGGLKKETTKHLFTFSNKAISDFIEGCFR